MKASSMAAMIVVALASTAAATAQNAGDPPDNKKPVAQRKQQAKDQPSGQIFCKNGVPCRPVRKGCHLEQQSGGFNEEVCP
ncbi:hypothetical protein [Bradyrhizobium sp. 6(2017)]|uniref:hypothetical protein n=2 Tax=unclassified Bradyrhizobium TaxID=2631580 RepID=UPI0013E142AB|nr:hypothetical protein [Bradyrhizobium sp. 6(2017)]QIG98458.1 hypothetical protein G6P99_43935 [Bradyrhizobium sp. 6(2017)]